MGVGDEQVVDEIVFLGRRRLLAAPAALLRAVFVQRLGLDVAGVRQRHHHVFGRDQVFHAHVLRCASTISLRRLSPNWACDRRQFVADDLR